GIHWLVALLWTCLAALASSAGWVARPNLFTMLFVVIVARAVVRYHIGAISFRRLLWLCPMFTLWANIHGGFIAGFMILGLAWVAEGGQPLLPALRRGQPSWARPRQLAPAIRRWLLRALLDRC